MIRSIFLSVLVVSALLPIRVQIASMQSDFPSVSVLLPANISSETVQISYFLIGPFGGYGDYTKQRRGLQSYEIPAAVEGKAAREIRMIVYASGCEIETFVFPLTEGSRVRQKFECKRAATVHLVGQIVPTELATKSNAELVVNYMAYWAHEFFGIMDGRVTEFQLATVSPDSRGAFQVELPYFAADIADSSSQQRAGFRLTLRDSKTWNPIADSLEPQDTDLQLEVPNLAIRSHYPNGLKFTARTLGPD
jgi:hypothetical protein